MIKLLKGNLQLLSSGSLLLQTGCPFFFYEEEFSLNSNKKLGFKTFIKPSKKKVAYIFRNLETL